MAWRPRYAKGENVENEEEIQRSDEEEEGLASSFPSTVKEGKLLRNRRDLVKREDLGSRGPAKHSEQLNQLSEENDALRAKVVALRDDFESMLRQMNAIENQSRNGSCHSVDGDSIVTDDDSRVSSCIQRIEDVKSRAMEKLEGRELRRRRSRTKDKCEGIAKAKGERQLESCRDCMEDLLCENERLCE